MTVSRRILVLLIAAGHGTEHLDTGDTVARSRGENGFAARRDDLRNPHADLLASNGWLHGSLQFRTGTFP